MPLCPSPFFWPSRETEPSAACARRCGSSPSLQGFASPTPLDAAEPLALREHCRCRPATSARCHEGATSIIRRFNSLLSGVASMHHGRISDAIDRSRLLLALRHCAVWVGGAV